MPTENRSSNTVQMVSELLPCPFCGGKADSRCTAGPDPDWFVECTECLASAPVFNQDKLDGWNNRAKPIEQPQPAAFRWEQLGGNGWCYGEKLPAIIIGAWQELYTRPPTSGGASPEQMTTQGADGYRNGIKAAAELAADYPDLAQAIHELPLPQ